MHPRFVNPHLQPQDYAVTSRANLYKEDKDVSGLNESDEINRLQTLIRQTNPSLKHALRDGVKLPAAKRKKLDVEAAEDEAKDLVSFRLVSSQVTPSMLSLLPPPPPPPVTREPDTEDTEEQALLRRKRAEAAAIDPSGIPREVVLKTSGKKLRHATTLQPLPDQPLLALQTLQAPRKTRPPVPPDQLAHYPYAPVSKTSNPPAALILKTCDTVDVTPDGSTLPSSSSRQRRRRMMKEAKKQSKIRPQPQFWRPEPAWLGPCQGYAYGYPSSLAVGYDRWMYKPDKMRKAVWAEE